MSCKYVPAYSALLFFWFPRWFYCFVFWCMGMVCCVSLTFFFFLLLLLTKGFIFDDLASFCIFPRFALSVVM